MAVGDRRMLKTTQLHIARNEVWGGKKKKKSPVSTYTSLYFLKAGEGKKKLPDKPC